MIVLNNPYDKLQTNYESFNLAFILGSLYYSKFINIPLFTQTPEGRDHLLNSARLALLLGTRLNEVQQPHPREDIEWRSTIHGVASMSSLKGQMLRSGRPEKCIDVVGLEKPDPWHLEYLQLCRSESIPSYSPPLALTSELVTPSLDTPQFPLKLMPPEPMAPLPDFSGAQDTRSSERKESRAP